MGSASVKDCPNGQAIVNFPFTLEDDFPNYLILDTDYDTYSLVYGCKEEDPVANFWILARTPTLEEELI